MTPWLWLLLPIGGAGIGVLIGLAVYFLLDTIDAHWIVGFIAGLLLMLVGRACHPEHWT